MAGNPSAFAILLILIAAGSLSEGRTLATWDLSASDPSVSPNVTASYVTPGLTAGPLTFGSNLTRENTGWLFSNWPTTDTATPEKAFYFTLTPKGGRNFRLSQITVSLFRDNDGPQRWTLVVSSVSYNVFGVSSDGNGTSQSSLVQVGARGFKTYAFVAGDTTFTLSGRKANSVSGVGGLVNGGSGEGIILTGDNEMLACTAYPGNCGAECPYRPSVIEDGECGELNDPCDPSGSRIYGIITQDPTTEVYTVSRYSDFNCTTLVSTASSLCGDCNVPGTVMACRYTSCGSSSSSSSLFDHYSKLFLVLLSLALPWL